MLTIRILLFAALLITSVLMWKKPAIKLIRPLLTYLHLLFFLLTLAAVILLMNGYKFAGAYTNTFFAVSFLVTSILLFGCTKNIFLRFYSGLFVLLSILFELLLFFTPNALLLPFILAGLLFQSPKYVVAVNANSQVEVYDQFLGPPPVFLSENKIGLFKKLYVLKPTSADFYTGDSLKIIDGNDTDHIVCCVYHGDDSCKLDTLIKR
ncbi:MAG: hypothetical protein JST86_17680 [Bacteroidetes bacterium]|nr:hypothetical protein [Bacteroidota bacterium]